MSLCEGVGDRDASCRRAGRGSVHIPQVGFGIPYSKFLLESKFAKLLPNQESAHVRLVATLCPKPSAACGYPHGPCAKDKHGEASPGICLQREHRFSAQKWTFARPPECTSSKIPEN